MIKHLTQEEVNILKNDYHEDEKSINQIDEFLPHIEFQIEYKGKKFDYIKARTLMTTNDFVSGVDRAVFHHSASRMMKDGRSIYVSASRYWRECDLKQDIRNAVMECKSQGIMEITLADVISEFEGLGREAIERYKSLPKKEFTELFASMNKELQDMVDSDELEDAESYNDGDYENTENEVENGERCRIIKPKTSHKEKEIER